MAACPRLRALLRTTALSDIPSSSQTQSQTDTTSTDDAVETAYVSTLPGVLGTLDVGIARLESVLLAGGVLLMAVNTIANVVGRYVFQSSLFFSEELNRILIIVITFAGISYAARQGRHIRMSAIYDALPGRARKGLMIVIALVTAGFMFLLCWYSAQYLLTQAGRGRVLPALQIPVWTTLIIVPVGFFMTGLQYLLTAIKNIISRDIYLSTVVLEGYEEDEMEV
ncbi:TRAP-type C4-dicarboxylate transport system permease small subunit [Rhodovulum euryhalinum]|uniref:TRAP transporter small permease protein n=1 Tax=Rhodovulum euryhalinum TaxID=35805 RepID=A0A4R2KV20_9RHOB|nr:TRAP transporter small permease [Rhodovulum euryhalinum]TCO74038.1 TRAP-type C4-dicarboxylate transport system permease small subunit [Rhodovulum euryhalinum]